MSEFSGYEKMPNSIKKLGLDASDFSHMEKLTWVVTEKIHGANFSFVYEKERLRFAKRKEYLSWKDDFFGFQLVVNRMEDPIIRLFEDLSAQIKGNKFIIYGELFGGKYPHPDVAPAEKLHPIQTGVYYSPNIHFCAFDIAIETEGAKSKYYLDYESSLSFFEKHHLFHAKPLFIGKYRQAMNFDLRINSTIPQQLNLPALKENLIEGIVVKPFDQLEKVMLSPRPIIKLKNPEFDENKAFHQAEKWSYIPAISSKTEDLSFMVEELKHYITRNRLESAISKIGDLDFTNEMRMQEIATEFLQDALVDFNEDHNNLWEELSIEQQDWIQERIKAQIHQTLITYSK